MPVLALVRLGDLVHGMREQDGHLAVVDCRGDADTRSGLLLFDHLIRGIWSI
jgi:hypothetical protein